MITGNGWRRLGQPKIEEDEIVGLDVGGVGRALAVGHPIDRVGGVLERLRDRRSDHAIVLDK